VLELLDLISHVDDLRVELRYLPLKLKVALFLIDEVIFHIFIDSVHVIIGLK
jgi:hypothetical protein